MYDHRKALVTLPGARGINTRNIFDLTHLSLTFSCCLKCKTNVHIVTRSCNIFYFLDIVQLLMRLIVSAVLLDTLSPAKKGRWSLAPKLWSSPTSTSKTLVKTTLMRSSRKSSLHLVKKSNLQNCVLLLLIKGIGLNKIQKKSHCDAVLQKCPLLCFDIGLGHAALRTVVLKLAGRTLSVRVMKDERSRSRGFGFVNYANHDDAQKVMCPVFLCPLRSDWCQQKADNQECFVVMFNI